MRFPPIPGLPTTRLDPMANIICGLKWHLWRRGELGMSTLRWATATTFWEANELRKQERKHESRVYSLIVVFLPCFSKRGKERKHDSQVYSLIVLFLPYFSKRGKKKRGKLHVLLYHEWSRSFLLPYFVSLFPPQMLGANAHHNFFSTILGNSYPS